MGTSNFQLRTSNFERRTSNFSVRLGLVLIRGYQLLLSPFAGGACRFEPSCSEYAMDAVQTHGLVRGVWLAVGRIARCHPFSQPGLDPVPPRAGTPGAGRS